MAEDVRVLVDSSAWIDFLRGDKPTVHTVKALGKSGRVVICGQVRQDVLQGSRDTRSFEELRRQMSIWAYEPEIPEDFVEAARIFSSLRWKGLTIPPSDCLVAALALRLNLSLYATDPDFDHIPRLARYER